MTQRRYTKEQLLSHLVGVRVSEPAYNRLEKLRKQSNCRTIGEFARKILLEEKIIWYHKDATMDGVAAELAGIRKELNAIGKNINQVTRQLNSNTMPGQKIYDALKILDEYRRVSDKVENLLTVISNLAQKWSPK